MGQHSPKIGRRPSKYLAFYSVFFAVPIFRIFWLNTGQHRPPDRQPTYPPRRANIAPKWANIAPRWTNIASRWGNIALRSCFQLDPYHLNMGPWPAVARKRLNIRAPAPGPCPRRRPSVVTEGYIRSPPLPPTGSARFRPTPGPPPVHPRPTIIPVIYSVFCVWCSKKIVFYRVLWPWPSPGFILATLKNHGFFMVLGLRQGSGTENWTSCRPWCQHRANIGQDVGYSLRQHRANIGPRWPQDGPT